MVEERPNSYLITRRSFHFFTKSCWMVTYVSSRPGLVRVRSSRVLFVRGLATRPFLPTVHLPKRFFGNAIIACPLSSSVTLASAIPSQVRCMLNFAANRFVLVERSCSYALGVCCSCQIEKSRGSFRRPRWPNPAPHLTPRTTSVSVLLRVYHSRHT